MFRFKSRMETTVFAAVVLLGMAVFSISARAATVIETTYAATGSLATSTVVIKNEAGADLYKIYYPAALSGNHPIVVWGNGSDADCLDYDALLTHLASWGFVVIGNFDTAVGTGEAIIETMNYLVARNGDPASIFYQKLDVGNIGLAGHSQGAGGVVNAATNFTEGDMVTTLVPVSLPALKWCDAEDIYDTSLVDVPVFFTRGNGMLDGIIAPLADVRAAYNALPSGVGAAMGTCKGTDHNTIQGNGGKLRGYVTAWLRYQLANDATARNAFAGTSPELPGNTTNWKDVAVKSLP
ncbi:MAG: alpha/beta hydrolase [Spirochaetes bacterium]|nr:MAG: alpha/beta hydrolase [Spirochaetota bacterium]